MRGGIARDRHALYFGGARRRRAVRWLALLPVVGGSAAALAIVGPVEAGEEPARSAPAVLAPRADAPGPGPEKSRVRLPDPG